ncbi:hypothetical protein, partial [Mycobacterium avium]
ARFAPPAPPLVGVGWISETYGVSNNAVYQAIRDGRLPVVGVPGKAGKQFHVARPEHVFRVWGPRLIKNSLTRPSRKTPETV